MAKTIRFPQLNLVAGEDELRPMLEHIQIKKKTVCATDAIKIVVHDTEELFDDPYSGGMYAAVLELLESRDELLIHRNEWKKFTRYFTYIRAEEAGIIIKYPKKEEEVLVKFSDDTYMFPQWERAIPTSETPVSARPVESLPFEYLSDVVKGMTDCKHLNYVSLTPLHSDNNHPVRVELIHPLYKKCQAYVYQGKP